MPYKAHPKSDMYKDPFSNFFIHLKYNPEITHIGITAMYIKENSK